MKKYIKYISTLLLAMICCMPMVVSAEPEDEYEPAVTVESFVIDSNENEKIKATMMATADTEISYSYTVSLVTDISQEGQKVASGTGKTGVAEEVSIDMTDANSYSAYRFKIVLTYTVDEVEEFATAFSKPFEFIQETYADELKGKTITVDMTSQIITIDWSKHMSYGADGVLVTIDVDGENKVEEIIYSSDAKLYEHYIEDEDNQVVINLKQIKDGKLSQGITETINLKKDDSSTDFYLILPQGNDQYNRIWSIEYRNGSETALTWKTDNDKSNLTLTDDGTFQVEMEEDNQSLHIEYTDTNGVIWTYDLATDVAAYTPNIDMLESYNGSTVKSSSIIMVGKVSDTSAQITLNGEAVEVDGNGTFQGEVALEIGKNVVTIEATSQIGKTARKTVTIYRESSDTATEAGNILTEYMPLIITLGVSLVFIVVLILASKRKGKKHEKQA